MKTDIKRIDRGVATHPAWIVITLAAAIFAAWMFCVRPSGDSAGWHDDYAYKCVVNQPDNPYDYFSVSAKHIETFDETCQSVVNHYLYVNGRLANLLLYLLNYLPAWVLPLLHGAAYLLMISGIMRLGAGGGYAHKPLAAISVVWWVWVVFPWFDMSVCTAYVVNYIWTSAACLWSIYAMLDARQQSRLRWLWLIIPAAAMHEGFSSIIGVGMLVWIIARWREYRRHPRRLILPAAFAVFSTFTLLSPGFQTIVGTRSGAVAGYFDDFGTQLLRNWPIYFITPVYIIWCIRHRRHNKYGLAYAAMLLAGVAMMIFTACTGRALWMTYLLITTAMLQMCARIRLRRPVRLVLTMFMAALLLTWGFFLCKYQLRFTREKNAVESEIKAYQDTRNYIFSSVSFNEDSPWWLFDVPEASATNPKTNLRYVRLYNTDRKGVTLHEPITLPEAADLQTSISRMRRFPSGLRGDIHGVLTAQRDSDKTLNFTFDTKADTSLPGWHPIYSLYKYEDYGTGRFTLPFKCEERCLVTSTDTLWYYFIPHTPRSLASHKLLDVNM